MSSDIWEPAILPDWALIAKHLPHEGLRQTPNPCKSAGSVRGGTMLEQFSYFFVEFYAWKCFNCGAMIDRTIATNRRKSLAAREAQTVAAS